MLMITLFALVVLGSALLVLALRRLGEEGLVLVPTLRQSSPSPLTATPYSRRKARFDTRCGGRLMARLVGSDGDHLLLRRGNGPVFRRLRAS